MYKKKAIRERPHKEPSHYDHDTNSKQSDRRGLYALKDTHKRDPYVKKPIRATI